MSQPNLFIAKLAQPLQAGGSETEIFLDRITTITGETITTSDFSLFNRGVLTINPDGDGNRSFPEYASFTAVDATELSLTGAVRGLSAKGNTVVDENKRYHPAGTRVAITFGTHDIADIIAYINAEIAALSVGSNQVVTGTAGEVVAAGEVVYLKDDGKWWLARADQTATIYNVQLGIAQGAGLADASITNGVLRLGSDANQTGLTVGDTIYVSDTPGAIATTAGTNERIIGEARAASNIYFDPNVQPNGVLKAAQSGGGDFGTPSASNKFLTEESIASNTIFKPIQVVPFTSSGTWTKDAGLKYVVVEVVGGGGGGGAVSDEGGGGAGGYSRKLILASELGATEVVTVGAGGAVDSSGTASSFGSHCTGNGGGGTNNHNGGGGGSATGGDINFTGNGGEYGVPSGTGGRGGSSFFGGASAQNSGSPQVNSGSGGRGGVAGASGIVIVTEYYA